MPQLHRRDTHAPEVDASFGFPPHHIPDEVLNFKVPAARQLSVAESGGPIAEVLFKLRLRERRCVAETDVPFTFVVTATKRLARRRRQATCASHPCTRRDAQEPRIRRWKNACASTTTRGKNVLANRAASNGGQGSLLYYTGCIQDNWTSPLWGLENACRGPTSVGWTATYPLPLTWPNVYTLGEKRGHVNQKKKKEVLRECLRVVRHPRLKDSRVFCDRPDRQVFLGTAF